MSIQQEIKSQLAKLLATEDLIVEHKQVETASFNVETRVLVLPLWEKASSEVYDMLVAHEVGHALFTPCEDWTDRYDIPPSFVNIVEMLVLKVDEEKVCWSSKDILQWIQGTTGHGFLQVE